MAKKYSRRFLATKSKIKRVEKAISNKKANILPSPRYSPEFKQIVKYFIKPLLSNQALQEIPIKQKLDIIFGTDFRQIITFVSLKPFKMPGFVPYPEKIDVYNHTIRVGDILIIRTDVRTPNLIDVESVKNNLVYRLTSLEYVNILESIERITPCQANEAILKIS